MTLADYIMQHTGKALTDLFPRLVVIRQDIGEDPKITHWDASLGAQPTSEDVAAALAAGPTQAQLVAYANAHQWALATGGYTVTLTPVGATTAQAITFATDTTSLSLMDGKVARLGQATASFVEERATDLIARPAEVAREAGPRRRSEAT